MLVQIIVIKQNVTLCKQARIPSGTSCFLNIVFKRIGNIIVNNQLDVFLSTPIPKAEVATMIFT